MLLPKALPVNFSELGIQSLQGIDLVEFNHGFYQEHFRDMGLSNITKGILALRLCAFVDLGTESQKANIPLSQSFAARFVTILATS